MCVQATWPTRGAVKVESFYEFLAITIIHYRRGVEPRVEGYANPQTVGVPGIRIDGPESLRKLRA